MACCPTSSRLLVMFPIPFSTCTECTTGRESVNGRAERDVPPPVGCSPLALRPPTLLVAPMLANGAGGRAGSMVPPPGAIGQLTLLGAGQWPCARPRWMERQCWPMALGECCEHGAASRGQGPALAPAHVGCSADAGHWR